MLRFAFVSLCVILFASAENANSNSDTLTRDQESMLKDRVEDLTYQIIEARHNVIINAGEIFSSIPELAINTTAHLAEKMDKNLKLNKQIYEKLEDAVSRKPNRTIKCLLQVYIDLKWARENTLNSVNQCRNEEYVLAGSYFRGLNNLVDEIIRELKSVAEARHCKDKSGTIRTRREDTKTCIESIESTVNSFGSQVITTIQEYDKSVQDNLSSIRDDLVPCMHKVYNEIYKKKSESFNNDLEMCIPESNKENSIWD